MRGPLYLLILGTLWFLPNRLLTSELWHEYLAFLLFLLGGIHLVLVRRYLRALIARRLPFSVHNTVNALMLALLVITAVTGILISLYAVPIVRLRGLASIYVHAAHLSAGVLFYLLVGIHAGFHWRALWSGMLQERSLRLPACASHIWSAIGILLIIAGLYSLITTHIYEKVLFEHMSFGGIAGTWTYQLDLLFMFAGCMSAAIFYERLQRQT